MFHSFAEIFKKPCKAALDDFLDVLLQIAEIFRRCRYERFIIALLRDGLDHLILFRIEQLNGHILLQRSNNDRSAEIIFFRSIVVEVKVG